MEEEMTRGTIILIIGLVLGIVALSSIQYYNTTDGMTSRMLSGDAQFMYEFSCLLLFVGGIIFLIGFLKVLLPKSNKPTYHYTPIQQTSPPRRTDKPSRKTNLPLLKKKGLKTLKKSTRLSKRPNYCKKCGHELDKESYYCENCGNEVKFM